MASNNQTITIDYYRDYEAEGGDTASDFGNLFSEWVRALRALGISRSIFQISILSTIVFFVNKHPRLH